MSDKTTRSQADIEKMGLGTIPSLEGRIEDYHDLLWCQRAKLKRYEEMVSEGFYVEKGTIEKMHQDIRETTLSILFFSQWAHYFRKHNNNNINNK